ncbi:Kinase-like protein [Mycena sanguinolenta]|uniref:Kinase-like protein n=1 Tax=Mycena sanguinolenta TaxID=230812 RepID=A0A8H6Z9M8_9AGAR|nr:Kinase-like protein [Mycena sanguinolenta]
MATMKELDTKFLVYEASLSFLKGACNSQVSQMTVDEHITSMSSTNLIDAVVESLGCRKILLELSTKLGLVNHPQLRTALRADEERIATFLVSIFSSKSAQQAVLRLEGDSAQHFLDVVQECLDNGSLSEHVQAARRITRKLSEASDKLPSSLFIVGVNGQDVHPSFGGGYGDIYLASYRDQRVALKRMRHFLRDSESRRMRLIFCREALVWKDLCHPHILPFLGIDRNSFPPSLCMVSPFMKHGTVLNYLKTHGHANVDKLLYEVAQGLEYLHSHRIVHGDLRGINILITEDWNACLADFGLSIVSDFTPTKSTTRAGSLYWMAPELLDPDRFGLSFNRTPATDVYAFGCVCFELYTGRPPFSNLTEPAALLKVLNGDRPERPASLLAMSDMLWQHVEEFWAQDPTTRPSAQIVVEDMVWPPVAAGSPSSQLPADAQPMSSASALYDVLLSSIVSASPRLPSWPTPVNTSFEQFLTGRESPTDIPFPSKDQVLREVAADSGAVGRSPRASSTVVAGIPVPALPQTESVSVPVSAWRTEHGEAPPPQYGQGSATAMSSLQTSSPPTTYHRPMQNRGPLEAKVLENDTKTTQDIGLLLPQINVLIVEDNVVAQMMLTGFLRKKKFKYQLANNGLEAVNKYKTEKFHFILMDLFLPVMDGIDATKEIRRLEKLNAAPEYHLVSSAIIVGQTASLLQSDRVKMLAAGCNDFVPKPINLQWLNSTLREWGSIKGLPMGAKTPLSEAPPAGTLDAGLASVIPALSGLDIQDFFDLPSPIRE